MFNEKPVISSQHGALVMALVPFLYAIFSSQFSYLHFFFGFSWLFLYLCSYPFFSLLNKKPTQKNKKWAILYFCCSLLFFIPIIYNIPSILIFFIVFLPLALIQTYFAIKKDERHIANDIAGILTFGLVGMASYYLTTEQYNLAIFIHPSLFFIACTLYIKSMLRERKNPLYLKLNISSHWLCLIAYIIFGYYFIAIAYLFATIRAILIPKKHWNVKQIGMFEFVMMFIYFASLILDLSASHIFIFPLSY